MLGFETLHISELFHFSLSEIFIVIELVVHELLYFDWRINIVNEENSKT